MLNHLLKKTLPVIMLAATLLAACGANPGTAPSSTNAIDAIYTTAAQTLEAQYIASATQSAADQNTTPLPTDAFGDLTSPTSFPNLTYLSSTPIFDSALNSGSSSACDNSIYISDVTIPDNTVIGAGQAFTKTWMFQNTGSCAWDANYSLTFISGDQMSGVNTSIDTSVAPGAQAELSVSLTAPSTSGNYTGYWQLANDSGTIFGAEVYVLIDITVDATATPTITPETPTVVSTTSAPPTSVATTVVPATAVPTTSVPPTAVPTTVVQLTAVPTATAAPPTTVPTSS